MYKKTEESKVITGNKKHDTIDIPFDLITSINNNDKTFAYLVLPGHIYDDYGTDSTDLFQSGYWIRTSYTGIENDAKSHKETSQNSNQINNYK